MLPVSLSLAAALGLLNLWLGYRTVRVRLARKVMIGDGGDALLQARMRAQANLVEYAPFVLALVVLIELAGGQRTWLWTAALLFLIGRVAHPFGLERPSPNPLRAGGILSTFVVLAALAVWAAVIARTGPVAHETYL